jgi:hypothetical protein
VLNKFINSLVLEYLTGQIIMTDMSDFVKGTTSIVGMGLVAGVGLSVAKNMTDMTNNMYKTSQPRRRRVVHRKRKSSRRKK